MKERPILFSGPMVRAILDGRKTQTRRVVRPQPVAGVRFSPFVPGQIEDGHGRELRCPYGVERLWVRETWAANRIFDDSSPRIVGNGHHGLWWKADHSSLRPLNAKPGRWRPSIHMPRWASRITLEVTGVRVERLQGITTEDALAEGIELDVCDQALVARKYDKPDAWFQVWTDEVENYSHYDTIAIDSFRTLWDSINAKRGYGWDSNPWVWVIQYRHLPEQEEMGI